MKKKPVYVMLVLAAAGILGGCGASMPELSEEEYAMVAEYAAGEVMKYNRLNEGRIVSDEAVAEQLAEEEQFRKNTEEYLEKVQREEEEEKKAEKGGQSGSQSSDQPQTMENADIASFIGISPLTVQYTGMEVCDFYPQSGAEDIYFSMDATPGKKLVVFKFQLANPTESDVELNVLETKTSFYVTLHGGSTEGEGRPISILATMLPNDLATSQQVMTAGSSEEAVLVLELADAEAENIAGASLLMRRNGESATSVLQ